MEVQLYIKGQKIDLFKDEKISINLSVKNINDLSKVLTDFTQSFTIPCTPNNNSIFEHWYNADVDGTFNSNIRVEAYLEVNSLPFRYGSVQLENAKLKNGLPHAYSCTFFGAAVSLSDLFKDDMLSDLISLSDLDHNYNGATVVNSMNSNSIHSGDVYYPLISCINEMSLNTGLSRDLENASNAIYYREFKPALRELKIIEAIETKYNITFSRDFFSRSVFHNLFLWLNKEAGAIKAFGSEEKINLQTTTAAIAGLGFVINTATDEITYISKGTGSGGYITRSVKITIYPQYGNTQTPYIISYYKNGIKIGEAQGQGIVDLEVGLTGEINYYDTYYFTISSSAELIYHSIIKCTVVLDSVYGTFSSSESDTYTSDTLISSSVSIPSQMPELKIKDYLNSLILKFNLVIVPITTTSFYIDTLDSWHSKGKTYNLNKYIDIKDIEVKKPSVKKKIEFLYQKTETILGKRYFDANAISYGDLKTTFDISGDDLKIESQFENMMFERLQRETDGDLTDLQAGYCIDKNLKPVKTKPTRFYRNGIDNAFAPIKIQPQPTISTVWHTATEDNRNVNQVTNCLNFGSDISTYFYTPIENSLYFNWWKTYIEDLFNMKNRVLSIKGKMPTYILYQLKMNDRFVVQDRRYKISDLKIDLTTGDFSGEIYTDFSKPTDTIDNEIPLTVDNAIVKVDSVNLTVDKISTYSPILSFITNGISMTNYTASRGTEFFEVNISANTDWNIAKVDTGFGVSWFDVNKTLGSKSGFVKVEVQNTTANRTGILRFNIGTETFDITISQP